MPSKTIEEIFEANTGKKAKIQTTDGVHIAYIEIYNPEFVEWLKEEYKFLEYRLEKEGKNVS